MNSYNSVKYTKWVDFDKMNSGKCNRITKKDLIEYIKWTFEKFDNGNIDGYSCQAVSNMYLQETGNYISNATIRNNKGIWTKNIKGELVKIR